MKRLLPFLLTLALGYAVHPPGVLAQGETVALRGARLLTITQGEIEHGVIVITDGRISAIGSNISIPSSVRVIDVSGKTILPGMIDGFTNLGLADYPSYGEDDDEATNPVTPQMQVVDGLNPANRFVPLAGQAGITTALCAPAEGNLLTGRSALIRTYGSTVDEMVIGSPVGVHVTLGEAPKLRYGPKNTTPMTRMGAAALLRQTLIQAQEYADKIARYESKQALRDEDEEDNPSPPARDLKLEALLPVLRREVPLIVSADRFDDIHTALRITEEFSVPMILNRGAEAHRVASLLAERAIPVIWGPARASHRELEARRGTAHAPALLAEAGVQVAFQTGGVDNVDGLVEQARIAMRNGLPREDALRALTLNPAQVFGVSEQLGSLEVGKSADLVVFSGDPLEELSSVEMVFIGGRQVVGRQ
jgi:imidazolonepropionase-like amidohydrolase